MSAAPRRATYEDLIAVPGHLVAEILDGELVTSPRPASPHAFASSGILAGLHTRFHGPRGGADAPGGWWILVEPELHLGQDVLVPDVAGWRMERMPVVPDVAGFVLPPDWVCEVISPSTGRIDRTRKMPIYAREGVPHLWLVDPLARTLEAYHLDAGRWVVASVHGGAEPVRVEPFDRVSTDMGRWWLPGPDATASPAA